MIYIIYLIISLLFVAADYLTKYAVITNMSLGKTIPLWEGVFHLTHIRNTGAAFSIMSGQRFFLIALHYSEKTEKQAFTAVIFDDCVGRHRQSYRPHPLRIRSRFS